LEEAKMNILKIVNQVKDLIINPKGTLKKLKDEKVTFNDILIYLAIVNIPTLIGLFIGHTYYWHADVSGSFVLALVLYIATIVGVIIGGFILNMVAPYCKTKQNQMQAIRLFSYAATPFLLIGILNIYPAKWVYIISVLTALYCFYILYIGIPIFMETPKEQQMQYLIIAVIIFVVGWAILWGLWISLDRVLWDFLWSYSNGYYNGYYPNGY
jgi:hypothetical protein